MFTLALILGGCGADDVPLALVEHASTTVEPATTTSAAPSTTEATTSTEAPVTTVARVRPTTTVPAPTRTTLAAPAAPSIPAGTGSGACGGTLPPCSVMQRESASKAYPGGGDPDVYNAQGSGASGKWQVMPGTWDGYGGYANAADAPAAVQDDFAQDLWDGGAGCAHWNAC